MRRKNERGGVPANAQSRWARQQRWVVIETPEALRVRSSSGARSGTSAALDAGNAEGRAHDGARSGDRSVLSWVLLGTATLVLTGCAAALLGRATSGGAYGDGSSQGKSTGSSGGSQQGKSTTSSNSGSSQQRSGGSATAPAGSGARTAAQVEQDRQLVVAVRNRLSADGVTKGLSIAVDTYRGVVTLRGSVDQAEQRSAAERVARGVSGVRNVQNELRVR